jgi:ABC-type molybdate transport system substrate-binding protein
MVRYQPTGTHIDVSNIRVTIATLKSSKHAKAAEAFAEFVNSRRGRAVFGRYGFGEAQK